MSAGREVRAIGYAGWQRTLGAGIISLAYFFPVFYIIITAFKTRPDALAMPIKFLFTPTLQNFYSVFVRADIQGGGTTPSVDAGLSFLGMRMSNAAKSLSGGVNLRPIYNANLSWCLPGMDFLNFQNNGYNLSEP